MFKLYSVIPAISLVVLISCNSKKDKPPIIPSNPSTSTTPSTPVATVELSDPFVPDSISFYRPQFGAVGTVRHFPFGPVNRPAVGIRLTKIVYNGKLWRTYEYNSQGQLSERTDFYTNGLHIYRKFKYSYDLTGIVHIIGEMNKEAPNKAGFPINNELLPSFTADFKSANDTISRMVKTTNTVFIDWNQPTGINETRLGFSPTGAFIWEEKDDRGKLAEYSLYRRNEAGNVILHRDGGLSRKWAVQRFTYDDKPNPYHTTGDFQTIDVFDFDTTNPNNVLTQQYSNSEGGRDTWSYVYEYRADGYPSRVKVYRRSEPERTIEYIYNQ